ncbi:MAG: phosphate signaling complex protein PhoU [Candidatus Omnitrophica bacterium]|nr:phosphate signaling complex protein PhoU [Candidatus Omnitrophota bacterium]
MERHLDENLTELKTNLLNMGAMVQKCISDSIESLKTLDTSKAKEVIECDEKIDKCELKIDEQCLDLLVLKQPVAVDFRFVTMVMKITNDLERIADLAVDISERVLELSGKPHLKPLIDIPKLTVIAQKMLEDALTSFINQDAELAKEVILRDTEANHLRDLIQEELIKDFIVKDSNSVTRAIPLLLIARHLERICDHTTNIAEYIIYMVEAKIVKHRSSEL